MLCPPPRIEDEERDPRRVAYCERVATLQVVGAVYEARLNGVIPDGARALMRPFALGS